MKQLPFRVGLIGCGDVAEKGHLPALLQHDDFVLCGLCDRRVERARLLSNAAGGAAVFDDYRELLRRTEPDAVILALHPEVSIPIALNCLKLGFPILDEKPLARTLNEGNKLARFVRSKLAVYQIGFCFRYSPWVEKLAVICREIGSPALYRFGIFDEHLDRGNHEHFNRIQQILESSSAVVHEGSHVIDYFQICNPSRLIRARAGACRTEADLKGPNLWSCLFDLDDGSVLELEIGWLLPELPPCEVRIVGPGGVATLGYSGAGTIARRGVTTEIKAPRFVPEFSRQLDHFARTLQTGRVAGATVEDGLRALAATEACQRSVGTGRTVEIRALA